LYYGRVLKNGLLLSDDIICSIRKNVEILWIKCATGHGVKIPPEEIPHLPPLKKSPQ
jgi:hypothetical protein